MSPFFRGKNRNFVENIILMSYPIDFDKIPTEHRQEFKENYDRNEWDEIKTSLIKNDCFLSHCPNCTINKVVQEWTDSLFKFMKWEQWLEGKTWV